MGIKEAIGKVVDEHEGEALLVVYFNNNNEPVFDFKGAWNIQGLGRVRRTLLRAYKRYMRETRKKTEEKNERASE